MTALAIAILLLLALAGSATYFVASLRRWRTVRRCPVPAPHLWVPPEPFIDLSPVVGLPAVEGPDGHLYVMPTTGALTWDHRMRFEPSRRIDEAAAIRTMVYAEAQVRARAGGWPRIPWDVV